MYWNDEKEKPTGFVVPDDVVDLAFRFKCPVLPLDHAHALSSALLSVLPWLAEESHAGVHLIHGAASGNGWYRPEDPGSEILHLSRRSRMRLRVPSQRLDDARELTGKTLDVAGHAIEVHRWTKMIFCSRPRSNWRPRIFPAASCWAVSRTPCSFPTGRCIPAA
jgi:CRISPR-associated protein Cas6